MTQKKIAGEHGRACVKLPRLVESTESFHQTSVLHADLFQRCSRSPLCTKKQNSRQTRAICASKLSQSCFRIHKMPADFERNSNVWDAEDLNWVRNRHQECNSPVAAEIGSIEWKGPFVGLHRASYPKDSTDMENEQGNKTNTHENARISLWDEDNSSEGSGNSLLKRTSLEKLRRRKRSDPGISHSRKSSWNKAMSASDFIQNGRPETILISHFTLKLKQRLSKETIELVGRETLKGIVKRCRRLYRGNVFTFFRPASRSRRIVETEIIPFVQNVNVALAKRRVGVYFSVESVYETVASNHPTYFLQVSRRRSPFPAFNHQPNGHGRSKRRNSI